MRHFVNKRLVQGTWFHCHRRLVGKLCHRILVLESKLPGFSQRPFECDVEIHYVIFQDIRNRFWIGHNTLDIILA